MSSHRRSILLLTLALGLSGWPAGAQGNSPARWQRQLAVDAAGPVAVRLEGRAAVEAARGGLRLLDPDGAEVDLSIGRDEAGERRAQVIAARAVAEGWRLEIDVGAAPPRHTRLTFALAETSSAEIVLEAGTDGRTWREIARAELFRLGDDPTLQRFALDYPPLADRYLRLTWPRQAEVPKLEALTVATVDEALRDVEVELACSPLPDGNGLDCQGQLPPLCQRVDIEIEPKSEPLGLRAWQARAGRWEQRWEGLRAAHGTVRLPAEEGPWRFRLDSDATPIVRRTTCWNASRILHFSAADKGDYRLLYGGLAAGGLNSRVDPSVPPAWVEPGDEKEGGWPAWPVLVEPAAKMPEVLFAAAWPVLGGKGEPAAGTLMRLAIEPEIAAKSRRGLSDLRLAAGGAQLPYVLVDLDQPLTLSTRERPEPQPDERARAGGRSGFGWTFKPAWPTPLATRELALTARGPFMRTVRITSSQPSRPTAVEPLALWPPTIWQCPNASALPCELRRSIGGELADLELTIDDGDDRPLPWVDVEVTEGQRALLFVWPGKPVTLHAGADLAAPTYDLQRHRELLRAREPQLARLGAADAPTSSAQPKWVLPLVIGLAALVLVFLLVRMIRHPT